MIANRDKQRITERDDPTSEHHSSRRQHADRIGYASRQRLRHHIQRDPSGGFTGTQRSSEAHSIDLFALRQSSLAPVAGEKGARRCHEAQTATASAPAVRSLGIDADVADLARGAEMPPQEFPADDHRPPDSGAEGQHQERIETAPSADAGFAPGRRVGVVVQDHPQAEARLELVDDPHRAPGREDRRGAEDAGFRLDLARRPDPRGSQLGRANAVLVEQLARKLRDPIEKRARIGMVPRRCVARVEQAIVAPRQEHEIGVGAAQIDAQSGLGGATHLLLRAARHSIVRLSPSASDVCGLQPNARRARPGFPTCLSISRPLDRARV